MRAWMLAMVAVAVLGGCRKKATSAAGDPRLPRRTVPAAGAAPRVDGELDDKDWTRAAVTGDFLDGARPAAPYSEARFLWRERTLYVGLYAADEDIRGKDAFEVELVGPGGKLSLRVPAHGAVAPAVEGVVAAQDTDGTVDDSSDDDEEWTAEVAVPFARLGVSAGDEIRATLRRCDTPKDGIERCGGWEGVLLVAP